MKANSDSEDQYLENILKATKFQERWWVTNSQQVIVPLPVRMKVMGKEHNKSLRGTESLTSSLQNSVLSVRMTEIEKSVTVQCPFCLKNNLISKKRPPPGTVKDKLHKA